MGKKKTVLALASAALGVVLLAAAGGVVFAQPSGPAQPANQGLAARFLDRLATNLGIQPQQLRDAVKTTGNQVIDEAVADGKLTEQRAGAIRRRLDQGGFMFNLPKWGNRAGTMAVEAKAKKIALDAIAKGLALKPGELILELRRGKTIASIAGEKQIEAQKLKDAAVQAVRQETNKAVSGGKLTQVQADKIVERIGQTDLSRNDLWRSVVPKGIGKNKLATS